MQSWRVLTFQRSEPKPISVAETLQGLVLKLQPLLARKEQARLLSDRSERDRLLKQLAQELTRAGLTEFNQLLAGICRIYFLRHETDIAGRFDLDDFIIEVQMLTYSRLQQFDPQAGGFTTWFSSCILPRVYTDLQRQINPNWGRPEPQTPAGKMARAEAFKFIQRLSLNQPVGEVSEGVTLESKLPAPQPSLEYRVLEDQCIEFFVQVLKQLSTGERALLRRLYLEEETQRSLAKSLGITPAAISIRLKKIHARLAAMLGTSFEDECANTQFCAALQRSDP